MFAATKNLHHCLAWQTDRLTDCLTALGLAPFRLALRAKMSENVICRLVGFECSWNPSAFMQTATPHIQPSTSSSWTPSWMFFTQKDKHNNINIKMVFSSFFSNIHNLFEYIFSLLLLSREPAALLGGEWAYGKGCVLISAFGRLTTALQFAKRDATKRLTEAYIKCYSLQKCMCGCVSVHDSVSDFFSSVVFPKIFKKKTINMYAFSYHWLHSTIPLLAQILRRFIFWYK